MDDKFVRFVSTVSPDLANRLVTGSETNQDGVRLDELYSKYRQNEEEKKYGFAKVRDAQYHMALYEILAEENHKHVAILKKRQIASSYFHMAKLLNQFWFEEGSICKIVWF